MTGGAGGAAGNGGVPALQGLGGGSATGIHFPSIVWLRACATESNRCEPPGRCRCFGSVFLALGPVLVDLAFCFVSRNPVERSERPHLGFFKSHSLNFSPLMQIWNMCNSGENIKGCVSKESACCEVLRKCIPPLPPRGEGSRPTSTITCRNELN